MPFGLGQFQPKISVLAATNRNMTMLYPAQVSRPNKRINHESNQMGHRFEHGVVFGKVMQLSAEFRSGGLRLMQGALPPSLMP
jgi:hypothetical protein